MRTSVEKYQRFLCKLLKQLNEPYQMQVVRVAPNKHEGVMEIHVAHDTAKECIMKVFIDTRNVNIPRPDMVQTIPLECILDGTISNENYVVNCIVDAMKAQRQEYFEKKKILKKHEELVEAQNVVI